MSLPKEDEILLKRLLSKDRQAVYDFYAKYSPILLGYITKKVGNNNDVEEIAQDTLFAFLEGARDFTGKCSLKTYLISIARFKIVDFYRKRKIKKILFSQMPKGIERLISSLKQPEEVLDQKLLTQKIKHVFDTLSPRYAKVLQLKYIENLSVVEIAKDMKCSFKSVESVLFRARKAFVKEYTIRDI